MNATCYDSQLADGFIFNETISSEQVNSESIVTYHKLQLKGLHSLQRMTTVHLHTAIIIIIIIIIKSQ